jgi:hypothetical protein
MTEEKSNPATPPATAAAADQGPNGGTTPKSTNASKARRNRRRGPNQSRGKQETSLLATAGTNDTKTTEDTVMASTSEPSETPLPVAETTTDSTKAARGAAGRGKPRDGRRRGTTKNEDPGAAPRPTEEMPIESGDVVKSAAGGDGTNKSRSAGSKKKRTKRASKPAGAKKTPVENVGTTAAAAVAAPAAAAAAPVKPNGVRPTLRIRIGSATDKLYRKRFMRDDVVIVPELFGKEDDLSMYETLLTEIKDLPHEKVDATWHQGCHVVVVDPTDSTTFQKVIETLCEYFSIKKDSISTRLNWYQDSKDWKPFENEDSM